MPEYVPPSSGKPIFNPVRALKEETNTSLLAETSVASLLLADMCVKCPI